MDLLLQALVLSASNVAIYLLLGLSVTLIFGILHVLNFAQGDFMTVAAYTGYASVAGLALGLVTTAAIVVPVLFIVGTLFYYTLLWPMRHHKQEMVLVATFGLALLLQGLVHTIWGGSPIGIARNIEAVRLGGVTISHVTLINVGLAGAGLMALAFLLHGTRLGREIRATAQDRTGASVSGVNTKRVELAAVIVAVVLSGLAGYMILQRELLVPEVGFHLVLKAFAVAIVAGLGRIQGLFWSAAALGLMEGLVSMYWSASLATATVFAVVVAVLLWRPEGLSGMRMRT